MYYVAEAKSGRHLPSSIPPEVVPPSCRSKTSTPQTVGSPPVVEKALPRPTSRPPADVTRVPAIQPPAATGHRRHSQATDHSQPISSPPQNAAAPPPEAAKPADAFGMEPASFDVAATGKPAFSPSTEKEVEQPAAAAVSAVPPPRPPSASMTTGMLTAALILCFLSINLTYHISMRQ